MMMMKISNLNGSFGAYLNRGINRRSLLLKSHQFLASLLLVFIILSTYSLFSSFLLQKHPNQSKMYKSAVLLAFFAVLAVAYSGVISPLGLGVGVPVGIGGVGLGGIGIGKGIGLGGVGLVSPLGLGLGKGIGIGGLGLGYGGLLGVGGLGINGLGLGLGGGLLHPGLLGGGIIG